MKMKMEESILKDFIIVRRDLFREFESGTVSYSEFITYVWLCRIADSFGYAHIKSHKLLAESLPLDIKPNTVGVILRSLRSHKWIDYEDRRGSRKGFKITIGFWPVGKGYFRNLDSIHDVANDITDINSDPHTSHLDSNVSLNNHMLPILQNSKETAHFSDKAKNQITSHNIKKEINKKIKQIDTSTSVDEDCIKVSEFRADTVSKMKLVEVARLSEERCMNYLIGKYNKHGENLLRILDKCIDNFNESNLENIESRPAYMNSLIEFELSQIELSGQ